MSKFNKYNKLPSQKIVMKSGGGLGQQLFMYAMYRYWEEKGINVYVSVDEAFSHRWYFSFLEEDYYFRLPEYFSALKVNTILRKDYYNDFFDPLNSKIKNLIKTRKLNILIKKICRKIKWKLFRINSNKSLGKIFIEEPWNRHEYFSDFSRESNIFIERGYFVSYTVPYLLRDKLLKEIVFDKPLPESVLKILAEIENTNSVSIHVRRRDYITSKYYRDRGYVCTLQYYKNAIDFMAAHYSGLKYYIFTDDMEWVKNWFEFLGDYFLVDTSELPLSAYYDMLLMSKCKHNIIANSTFSWWGAFFNENSAKTVVCPTDYRGYYIRADEVYPPEWIRVMTVIPPYIPAKYIYGKK